MYLQNKNVELIIINDYNYENSYGWCNLQHNRSHRRLLNYNWNKMKRTNEIDDTIIKRANKIINTWLLKSATNRNKKPLLTDLAECFLKEN